MAEKFEVSFNSPQCGWMSIGFSNSENEFHSTTAYTPHSEALTDILNGLTSLLTPKMTRDSFAIAWSRNPEEFDLFFNRDGENVEFKVIEYPNFTRLDSEAETVFLHRGNVRTFCQAFYQTFVQLYEARETDEFESNWKQPFPVAEFEKFGDSVNL